MTVARERLIDIQSTPYYHVINRCVRRAYLCGDDPYNGKSYEHRRQWIVDKIKALSGVFAIDICAYAIMSNIIIWCYISMILKQQAGISTLL